MYKPSHEAKPGARRVVVITTGGTIAGAAADPGQSLSYRAGELGANDLVAAVPALSAHALELQDLARLDSCDMDHGTWLALARAAQAALARPEVTGVVVTHGTDTLEETALFLHLTVAAARPVVLTAAMRPATALSADGPRNLLDAVMLAQEPSAQGVLAVLGGTVFAGHALRKLHGSRLEAFGAGDAGPVASTDGGLLRRWREWPDIQAPLAGALALAGDGSGWPWVEIVTSHAGARSDAVDALVRAGVQGLVIAGTGNGSVHHVLRDAVARAVAAGVVVRRASRCLSGGVLGETLPEIPGAGELTPAQARVQLVLELLARRA